jgi:acyl carrier protein
MIDLQQRISLLSPKKRALLALQLNQRTISDTKRLVAYIVTKQGNKVTSSELRDFLTSKLPEHMIPSAFVTLENLPLMPNGKINRRALRAADVVLNNAELETSFVAPRTATEEVLASIWAKVLGLPKVGIHNNFFELGGHSLLATQLIFQVRDIYQIELPVQTLFEAASVAEFAQILQAQSAPGQIEKISQIFQEINAMSVEDIEQTIQERQKREVRV